jgi:hypothetical protein
LEHSGVYQWENFFKAVRGESMPSDPSLVAMGIRVINAIARAQETGKVETIF